ncbi:MAG TPA: tetratricopeptide repeat protein [Nostocaceae cyanobacterium]|nr:tetratricopeptide repeat protein [Nostocaceae cyanobacterium]
MSDTQQPPLSVQPIISYPREAQVGKTYLMAIDLETTGEWLYEEEEYPIYCMLDTAPLFSYRTVGEPAIVLHRFGGTYGAAKFLLTAAEEEIEGEIKITLVNGWGVPVRVLRLDDVQVTENLSHIPKIVTVFSNVQLIKPKDNIKTKWGVFAAFDTSWQKLTDVAKQLSCLLSLFASAPILWQWVEQCLPDQNAEEIAEIRDNIFLKLNLLQHKEQSIYQFSPLLRDFFQYQLTGLEQGEKLKRTLCQVMVTIAKKIPETPNLEDISNFSLAIPHLEEVAKNLILSVSDNDLIWPFVGLGRFYEGQGFYGKAAPWREQCVEVTKQRLGEEHPNVATSLNNLAVLYYCQGRYDEAELLSQQALDLYRRLLGEENLDVANSLDNLAVLYISKGVYSEAEPLLQQALSLRLRMLGKEHLDVATSLNSLAKFYCSQGRYNEAEPLLLEALRITQLLQGNEHPEVATSLNNLGVLYRSLGRYDEAEPLLVQALKLRQHLLGEEHPDIAASMNNLGVLYCSQGRYNEAENCFVQALKLGRRLLGEEHPDIAISLNNLGVLHRPRVKVFN